MMVNQYLPAQSGYLNRVRWRFQLESIKLE